MMLFAPQNIKNRIPPYFIVSRCCNVKLCAHPIARLARELLLSIVRAGKQHIVDHFDVILELYKLNVCFIPSEMFKSHR